MRTSTAPTRAASSVTRSKRPRRSVTGLRARGPATRLLDHLVRLKEERLRNWEPESLRCLEVEHQLELGGLLNGDVGRLRALEDLVHEGGGAAVQVLEIDA